jgi:hypothetical protein
MEHKLEPLRFSYETKLFNEIKAIFGRVIAETSRNRRIRFDAHKRSLLGDSLRITKDLLPEVHDLYQSCLDLIGSNLSGDLYVQQCADFNASVLGHGKRFDLLVYSGLLDCLTPAELRFVIGHELGHVVFGHSGFSINYIFEHLEVDEEDAALLFRWSRSAEISCDRVGLLCCGELGASISALFKIRSGLTDIGHDKILKSFRDQYEALVSHIEKIGGNMGWVRTHPMIPIRFKAIELAALDIVALKKDIDSFNWNGFRAIDNEIGVLLEKLDSAGAVSRGIGSEDGQACTLLSLLYVALIDGKLSWNARMFVHDVHERLHSSIPISRLVDSSVESPDEFKKSTPPEIEKRIQDIHPEERNKIVDLVAMLVHNQGPATENTEKAVDQVCGLLGVEPEVMALAREKVAKGEMPALVDYDILG